PSAPSPWPFTVRVAPSSRPAPPSARLATSRRTSRPRRRRLSRTRPRDPTPPGDGWFRVRASAAPLRRRSLARGGHRRLPRAHEAPLPPLRRLRAPPGGHLEWATHPIPFRRYAGADLVRLPVPAPGRPLPYWQLYARGEVPSEPLSAESLSLFFRYSLSLTAWKRFRETTWSLRANPSSGNLHPTEAYAVLPAVEQVGDAPAVYHYAPKEHALERRAI